MLMDLNMLASEHPNLIPRVMLTDEIDSDVFIAVSLRRVRA